MHKNYIINPSFETNTNTWSGVNATLSRVSTYAQAGSYTARMVPSGSGQAHISNAGLTLEAGKTYTFSMYVKTPADLSQTYYLYVEMYTDFSSWGWRGSEEGGYFQQETDGYQRISMTFTMASDATGVIPYLFSTGTAANTDTVYFDAVMITEGTEPNEYFDGDTTGGFWLGTPHASESQHEDPAGVGMDNMRLEIEVPVEGLPNLVQNPSGDKGAWGWLSPVADTYITGERDATAPMLMFQTGVAQAAYFTSEFMEVAAGKYVGGRVDVVYRTDSNINMKARFAFYKADKTLISSSTQSGAMNNGTYYIPIAQAPALTAYVKVRFDVYRGTGNLNVNDWIMWRNAMVTFADTSGAIGSTRVNLVPNPSFETNVNGWIKDADPFSMDINRTTAEKYVGTAGLAMTSNGTLSSMAMQIDPWLTITPGVDYTVQARIKTANVNRRMFISVDWYTDTNVRISGIVRNVNVSVGEWSLGSSTVTAPSNAFYMKVSIGVKAALGKITIDEPTYFDAIMVEKASEAGSYIEGVVTNADFDFVEPYAWRNILGPTNEITIGRGALDVGLLSAVVLDPTLDPATYDEIRPGKQIRFRVKSRGEWRSEYEGRISNANVAYDRDKRAGSEVETRITLTASDNMAHLSNQGESRGVGNIDSLPYILEGKGAPWNINGSGNQVTSATIVSFNENASVVDQVAVARDTALGYAWVGKNNVLNVYDKADMDNEVKATFTDTAAPSYSDIDVNFNTSSCINEVWVNWLRYDVGNATTESVKYGPYRDEASVDTWGAYSADFTIQGVSEDAGDIEDYANAILAANAVPEIRANSIVFPVRTTTDVDTLVDLDLYSLVGVTYDNKVDDDYRISGIDHSIKATKSGVSWKVTYAFEVNNSVAAPTFVPAPPFSGVQNEGTEMVGEIKMWPTSTPPENHLICNGGTFSSVTYPALAAVVGDTFGTHTGTTYYLPDFRSRLPIGSGTFKALGANDGTAEASRTPVHSHGAGTLATGSPGSGGANWSTPDTGAPKVPKADTFNNHTHSISGSTGNSGTNAIPHLSINFIIRAA